MPPAGALQLDLSVVCLMSAEKDHHSSSPALIPKPILICYVDDIMIIGLVDLRVINFIFIKPHKWAIHPGNDYKAS